MDNIEETNGVDNKKLPHENAHIVTYKYLIAACIASLIISTFASVFFYQKWSEAEDHHMAILKEKDGIAQSLSLIKYEYEKLNSEMMVMHDPAMDIMSLHAVDSTKHFRARVYWNKYTHETYVDVQDLPMPPVGKQYQLWALVGGQPVDAGVFNMNMDMGMQKVKFVLNADQWAVTLEQQGGSSTPTLDQMFLISKS